MASLYSFENSQEGLGNSSSQSPLPSMQVLSTIQPISSPYPSGRGTLPNPPYFLTASNRPINLIDPDLTDPSARLPPLWNTSFPPDRPPSIPTSSVLPSAAGGSSASDISTSQSPRLLSDDLGNSLNSQLWAESYPNSSNALPTPSGRGSPRARSSINLPICAVRKTRKKKVVLSDKVKENFVKLCCKIARSSGVSCGQSFWDDVYVDFLNQY